MLSVIRYFLLAVWSMLCISSAILLMIILINRKIPLIMARTVWAPGIFFILGVQLNIKGLENVPKNEPLVVVSNHRSFLDIAIMFGVVPVNLYFVAKEELKKMPFIGWFMMATGMIFIDRSDRKKSMISLDKAGKLVNKGKNVILFPEGTRSKEGEIAQFKRGAFILVKKAKVRILPVLHEGTADVWNKDRFKLKSGRVDVKIGFPIGAEEYTKMNVTDLADFTKEKIVSLKED